MDFNKSVYNWRYFIVSIFFYLKVKAFFDKLIKGESGMGTIEVIIIIAVLVALALVFRNFIMDMAGMIFDKIKAKTDATINSL